MFGDKKLRVKRVDFEHQVMEVVSWKMRFRIPSFWGRSFSG